MNGVTTYSSCKSCCENRGTLTSCPTGYRCEYEACTNKYYKVDGCQSGYDWNATTQTCTSQCAASYKYDENNCPSASYFHCNSSTCGGKYTDCKTFVFANGAQTYTHVTGTYAASRNLCPGIKDFVQMIDPSDGSIDEVAMYNGDVVTSHGLNLCVDADQACYDLMNEIRNAKNGDSISVSQDMYCGNLAVFNNSRSNTITILGNNHTLTLKPSFRNIFYTPFKIENLNINLEVPHGILPGYHYHGGCDTLDFSSNIFYCGAGGSCSLYGNSKITVLGAGRGIVGAANLNLYGNMTVTCSGSCDVGDINVKNGGVLNLGALARGVNGDIFLYEGAVLNIKNYPKQYSNAPSVPVIYAAGENPVVNLCNWPGNDLPNQIRLGWQSRPGYNRFNGFRNITFNSNNSVAFNNRYNAPSGWEKYVILNTDSSVCSMMNF